MGSIRIRNWIRIRNSKISKLDPFIIKSASNQCYGAGAAIFRAAPEVIFGRSELSGSSLGKQKRKAFLYIA